MELCILIGATLYLFLHHAARVIKDRDTDKSRGFGFVSFSNKKDMEDAYEGMNGQVSLDSLCAFTQQRRTTNM